MVLPPSFSRKMDEIETVKAEKMGWLDLPRGTSYPTFPYNSIFFQKVSSLDDSMKKSYQSAGGTLTVKRLHPAGGGGAGNDFWPHSFHGTQ